MEHHDGDRDVLVWGKDRDTWRIGRGSKRGIAEIVDIGRRHPGRRADVVDAVFGVGIGDNESAVALGDREFGRLLERSIVGAIHEQRTARVHLDPPNVLGKR